MMWMFLFSSLALYIHLESQKSLESFNFKTQAKRTFFPCFVSIFKMFECVCMRARNWSITDRLHHDQRDWSSSSSYMRWVWQFFHWNQRPILNIWTNMKKKLIFYLEKKILENVLSSLANILTNMCMLGRTSFFLLEMKNSNLTQLQTDQKKNYVTACQSLMK